MAELLDAEETHEHAEVNPDLLRFWHELDEACETYLKAEKYYEGRVSEVFASARIETALAATGARYRFNLAKTPVDVLAGRVELTAVTVPNNEAATKRASEVWDANDMDVHYPDLVVRTLEYGDAYLMVWPVLVEEEDLTLPGDGAADDALRVAGVELTYHTPLHCRVLYDPGNLRRKVCAGKRWAVSSPAGVAWRVDLYYADGIERWVCPAGQNPDDDTAWRMYLETDEDAAGWLLPNEYGEIPFFHYRTATPYGRPEHESVYGCQDAINKMLITQLTTTDSHGFPQRYGLVDPAAELDSARDNPDFDDDLDAEDESGLVGGTGSSMRGGPGTMQDLTGYSEVGQFPAASPGIFLDPTSLYVRMMAQISGTPLHYFDPSGEQPSGESLKVADAPLIKRAERLKKMLRSPVSETWVFALRLLGISVQAVEPRWAPSQSAVGLQDWETVKAKIEAGVPQSVALAEAGYDPETVAGWLDEQGEAMALAQRVAVVNSIGDAVQKLGAGVALGVLDDAQVALIVETLLGTALPAGGGEIE